ncbi:MAG: hypothetical protein RLY31_2878 [Bacteroidota bacterium]
MKINRDIFNRIILVSTFLSFFMVTCAKEDGGNPRLRSDKQILYFAFQDADPLVVAQIDETAKTVTAVLPEGADITALRPTISVSDGATISPSSGEANDFTGGTNYKVTAEDGSVDVYYVQVSIRSNENELFQFDLPDLFQQGKVTDDAVSFTLPYGTDLTAVKVAVAFSEGATLNLDLNGPVDLTAFSAIEVTSAFGQSRSYALDITIEEQETGVRGVWLTNVASDVLTSKSKIAEAMQRLADLNFNTVFVVAWNKTQTPHPSAFLDAVIDDPAVQTQMFPGRDVLQEVIDEAHARGLKVIAWFEYGFAAQYGDANGGRNIVLQKHPEWESRDVSGGVAHQNGFYWMNAFHPEVQQFLLDLMLEVVQQYDVDGIQGDDRLPAITTTSGYDDYTVALYKSQHNGNAPPAQAQQQAWVQWRSDILTEYTERIYDEVKALKPDCIVSFSPSPYSFSFFNYCQDWPAWVDQGKVDILCPQLYRRDDQGLGVYSSLLTTNLNYANQNKDIYYPGVLLQVGGYVPNENYLVDVVRENRKKGVKGEVFFFYEGVKLREKAFRAVYPGKAIFPSF